MAEIKQLDAADLGSLTLDEIHRHDLIVVKNFVAPNLCQRFIDELVAFTATNEPRLGDRFREDFYQVDIEPEKSVTKRIFRTFFMVPRNGCLASTVAHEVFSRLLRVQIDILGIDTSFSEDPAVLASRPQVINYPRGGGYFDWHTHPRFPTDYGLILNLSRKGANFDHGQTEFEVDGEVLQLDNVADGGDMAMFRFDLPHRVAPVDPSVPLEWNAHGRWTAVLPVLVSGS
jgi:hypothetical protein